MKLVDGEMVYEREPHAFKEVYFVLARRSGLVKIGVAVEIVARLRTLQAGSPEPLVLLGVMPCFRGGELEREVHSIFAVDRAHGEWFQMTNQLLRYIQANAQLNPKRLRRLNKVLAEPVGHRRGRRSGTPLNRAFRTGTEREV